jgi:uncharacterized Zn-binding protein involved in type VI secretion
MPPVGRKGDTCLGHGSFPPTPAIAGSPDTYVNGIPLFRQGDAAAPHGSPSPSPPHGRSAASGSPDTYTNGKQSMRIGDPIDCGGLLAQGSPNTIIN